MFRILGLNIHYQLNRLDGGTHRPQNKKYYYLFVTMIQGHTNTILYNIYMIPVILLFMFTLTKQNNLIPYIQQESSIMPNRNPAKCVGNFKFFSMLSIEVHIL